MRIIIKHTFGLICLMFLAITLPVQAKVVSEIESFGVYVAVKGGYVKVGPYKYSNDFADFKNLNEIASAEREDEQLKIVVNDPNFSPSSYAFEIRPVQTTIAVSPITMDSKAGPKPGMYEFVADKPISNGNMLQVRSSFFQNFGIVMLGDTQGELVRYFSNKKLKGAIYVVQYLEDALVAFPNNAELKNLKPHWAGAAEYERDVRDWGYVEEKWKEYKATESRKLQEFYLNQIIPEINGYLAAHPKGSKAAEAKERKAHAEKTLKALERTR